MAGEIPKDLLNSFSNSKPLNHNKIVSRERVRDGNQMTETCKNVLGDTVKVSIFMDKNGDGNFDPSEVVSVKYSTNLGTKGIPKTVEYRDTDGDGFSDEIETKQGLFESLEKEAPVNSNGTTHRMDFRYGFKWDASYDAND